MLIVWECFLLSINHLEITGAGGAPCGSNGELRGFILGKRTGSWLVACCCVATFRSSLDVSNGPHTWRLPFLTPWQEVPYEPSGSWELNLRWKWNSLQTFTDNSWCFLRHGHKLQEIESQLWLYLEIWGRWGTIPEQSLLPASFSDNSLLSVFLPPTCVLCIPSCKELMHLFTTGYGLPGLRLNPRQN